MSVNGGYQKPFIAALALHGILMLFLLLDLTPDTPALTLEARNTPGEIQEKPPEVPSPDVVRAVSVDSRAVDETLNRLKAERENSRRAELQRQQALAREAQQALAQRIQEQKRLAALKQETEKAALARKKQMEDDARRLKELALKKAQETKQLEALQKQQEALKKQQEEARKKQEEALKAAKLADEKAKEQAKLEAARLAKAEADKKAAAEREAAVKKAALEAEQVAARAANQARIAGEVNKYKALIVNAISRQWILPDNADSGLSSQFRIRLAPDGAVLEVTLTRSSGDPVLDRSAQSAIYKASPLPVPSDRDTFEIFRDISLTVRPENVRG
ncbi:cell envelope integrity protein TolA [Legionella geestiana]|uniref:cell envelope integrity protein TolA n=1 Tax=Legionella geestiana TaxID=45065 RepID=UPI001093085C|nr:cell envelope integrity protein TolA [Legionella geestiana]QDQ39050.1 cell envelope integrity protein TolA [Legionella geestiana]